MALVTIAWLALLVAPTTAVRGSTRLSAPVVTPRSGTTSTILAFTVVYRNREGSVPDWVRVKVAGATHEMRALDPPDQVKDGVRFSYRAKLPVGTHAVTFSSRGRDKFEDMLAGGTVTIKAAASSGSGGSGGGGSGGSGGGGSGGSGSGGSGSRSTGGTPATRPGSVTPPPAQAPVIPVVPIVPPGVSPLDFEPQDPPVGPTGGGAGSIEAAVAAALWQMAEPADPGSGAGGSGPGGDGGGSLTAARLPGVHLPGDSAADLLATTLISSTITTVALAFLVFGKKRRDEEPPASEAELAHQASLPYAFAAAGALAYAPVAVTSAGATRTVPAFDPGTGGTDVDLPRWRRPSLLAARKYDPLRDARAPTRLTFDADESSGGARERRIVRYRVVRLLDRPDEILGVELGTLDEGDQVEILEQRGTYRRVLTPDGREGWVHKMTLGDRVGDDAATAATDPDIDADVLLAYLAARAHS